LRDRDRPILITTEFTQHVTSSFVGRHVVVIREHGMID